MKNIPLLMLCLSYLHLLAQDPVPTAGFDAVRVGEVPETRALIVGIADYKDSLIGDLHYANKDAEIFAEYLRSEAGGALAEENIWLMTNKQAMLGAIDNALNWLISDTKKGDKVIIYFSGHGDVERKTLWQRGYLLTYNTPPFNYRNNAIRVEELDEIVKTLSVGNEAKVVVILDACRSGKLANAGPSLTAEQLEKQVENEVRILSCKSDQKSLEGQIWGNGRGLFSYYFINGLKGLADKAANDDRIVTFEELKAFLEKNMTEALRKPGLGDRRQNPVFVGDERFEMAKVEDDMLADAARDMGLAAAEPMSAAHRKGIVEKVPGAGSEADLNASFQELDFSAVVQYQGFEQVLSEGNASSLFSFFTQNMGLNTTDSEAARHALAACLHDQAQDVINLYLLGDARTLDQRLYLDQAEKYLQYPRMLRAALLLLPQGHLLRKRVEVKLHYFDGVCTRLAGQMSNDWKARLPEAFAKQKKALALDDKAAYVHNEMGLLYMADDKLDKAEKHFKTAAQLAPNWSLPHANLCATYLESSKLQQAKMQADTAISLQPNYFGSYVNLGNVYAKERNYLMAELLYRKARELNDAHYLPFERRAYLLLETGRYEEADWQFYEMELRKEGTVAPLKPTNVVAGPALHFDKPFEYPSLSGPGVYNDNPKTAEEAFLMGKYYFEKNMYLKAKDYFKHAMRLDPKHREVYYYLGKISHAIRDYEAAEIYFKNLVTLRPEVEFMPFFLAEVYNEWQRPKEEESIYRIFLANSHDARILNKSHLQLATLLDKQGRYSEEEMVLWGLQKLDNFAGNPQLATFYFKMVQAFPNNPDWLYRQADFEYNQSSHYGGVNRFEQLLELDSAHAARAYIHALAGAYYLNEGRRTKLSETDTTWRGDMPNAIQHLRQAVAMAPSLPSAKYDLARACTAVFEYREALDVLRSLRDSNDLDFNSRLLLADLEMRSGNTEAADLLLQRAWDIQPIPVPHLSLLSGKLKQVERKPMEAIDFYRKEMGFDEWGIVETLAYSIARLHAQNGNKKEALDWLKKALGLGFKSNLVIKYDPLFNSYRNDPMFVGIIGEN